MTTRSIKEVVLCADDYALNAPVSQGIVALAVLGRLSATSVMSLSPRWAEDAVALRDVRERLDVGVHLDWTSGFAIDVGHGRRLTEVRLRSTLRFYSQEQLELQIAHQLDAFESQWQAAPDHIDSHQHVHELPVFRRALMNVLMRRYGAQAHRPWVRVSGVTPLAKLAYGCGWPAVSPVLGAYGFNASMDDYARLMQMWLGSVPVDQTALIMCNPAVSAQADDPLGNTRKREFAYLAGHDFVQHLLDANVRVVRGSGKPMLPV